MNTAKKLIKLPAHNGFFVISALFNISAQTITKEINLLIYKVNEKTKIMLYIKVILNT